MAAGWGCRQGGPLEPKRQIRQLLLELAVPPSEIRQLSGSPMNDSIISAPAPLLPSRELPAHGGSPFMLWRAVRKHWLMILTLTIAVALGVAFYTLNQTKIYKAAITIQIDPTPPRPLGNEVQQVVDIGAGAFWSNKEYFDTQLRLIRSRRVAERTVRTLGLNRDTAFLGNLPPGGKHAPSDVSLHAAAQIVRSRLSVEQERNSRLVVIGFEDADPRRAARIVGAVVDAYTQLNQEDVVASTGSAGDWLHKQLGKLKAELEGTELSLHEYKKDKGILSVSIDDQSNMLRAEMSILNSQLTNARTRRENLAARLKEIEKIDPDNPVEMPISELLANPTVSQLRAEHLTARRELESLTALGRGENHPDVKSVRARELLTREALVSELRNARGAVGRELAIAEAEIAGLSGLFQRAEAQAMDLNLLEIEYNRLDRTKQNTERLYGLVLEKTKQSDLTQMMTFNNIRVIDPAVIPRSPVRPEVPTSLALGVFAGLLLGVGVAVGRELTDRTIKFPEDLERELGLTYLGLLPLTAEMGAQPRRRRQKLGGVERAVELLAHRRPSSGLAEASRTVRTNILFMSPDHPHRRLLVTSAGAAEGKTTVACCIAVAMAQAGQRVLLMDCDLRRPRLHRVFDRNNDHGVSSLLIGESTIDVQSMETEVPNLWVLTAGPMVPSPAELLQSERFSRLLTDLSERFDRIIIDSSPLIPVTDAAVLSRSVDGTVLVVRAFETSRELAWQAARALRDVGAHVVGAVLNAVDLSRSHYGAYYRYYAYKQDGYSQLESDPNSEEVTRASA